MDKLLKIAETIIKDSYNNGRVYELDYIGQYSHDEMQHVVVRRILNKYGYLDWDDYNNMWHSFKISYDGIELVNSGIEIKRVKSYGYNIFGLVLFSMLALFLIWLISTISYMVFS